MITNNSDVFRSGEAFPGLSGKIDNLNADVFQLTETLSLLQTAVTTGAVGVDAATVSVLLSTSATEGADYSDAATVTIDIDCIVASPSITLDTDLGNASQNNTATTIALTISAAVAVGARIFVCVNYKNATALIASAADNGPGLTWTILDDTAVNGTSRLAWLSAHAPSGMSSGRTITVTLSGTPTAIGNICAMSFFGIHTTSPFRGNDLGTTGTTTWSITSLPVLPDDLMLVANHIVSSTSTTNTATVGTEIHDFYGGANQRAIATQYRIAPSIGSPTVSGTRTGLTGAFETVISLIALKPAVITDIQQAVDSATAAVVITPSTTEVHEIPDASTVLVDLQASGTDVYTVSIVDAATVVVDIAVAAVGQYYGTDPSENVATRITTGSSIYPRDAALCAATIRRHSWEPRSDNASANATMGSGSTTWGADVDSYWDAHYDRVALVAGQFTGTTTECISWAAARWGIDEDLLRAVAVQESDWHMNTIGDVCGPVGEASYGITQIKNKYCGGAGAWGGYPETANSTALNLDFYGAYIRSVFDGYFYDGGSYLYGGSTVGAIAAANGWDYVLWGAIGSWFSGDWYSAGAIAYINSVKAHLAARTWETYSPPAYTPPSGETAQFVEAATVYVDISCSGVDSLAGIIVDANTVLVDIQSSSIDFLAAVDTAALYVYLTTSAVEIPEKFDAATVLVDLQTSGTDVYTSLVAYTDTATTTITITCSSIEIGTGADNATALVDLTADSTDVAQFVDTATPTVLLGVTTVDFAPFLDAIVLPVGLFVIGDDALARVLSDVALVPLRVTVDAIELKITALQPAFETIGALQQRWMTQFVGLRWRTDNATLQWGSKLLPRDLEPLNAVTSIRTEV